MVGRIAKRRGHHACVGDDHIEGLAPSEQSIGAVSDAREAGQIEFGELEASTVRRRVLSYLSCRRLGLGQVARGANYARGMGGDIRSCFSAEPSRNACHQDSLTA